MIVEKLERALRGRKKALEQLAHKLELAEQAEASRHSIYPVQLKAYAEGERLQRLADAGCFDQEEG